mmetsp:Transcript_5393/g.15439  ORF Transcript_5393/g.15439 Transcript_5393/m.15439 type:complete len:845 (+) Transcript_5393:278-2812(+)
MDGAPVEVPSAGRPGSGKAVTFKPFKALGQVANAIVRTAGSAIALVEDAELRKKASDMVIGQANKGFNTVKQGVAHGADAVGQRIQSGPRQVQSVLGNLQKRIEEQRLANALREERDAPVDVQIGPQLYEGASQDLRRRLWIALLDNGSLARSVTHSNLSRTGSDAIGSDALSSQQPSMGRNSYRGDVVLEPLPEHTEGGVSQTSSPVGPDQLPPSPTTPSSTALGASSQPAASGELAEQQSAVDIREGAVSQTDGVSRTDSGHLQPSSPSAAALGVSPPVGAGKEGSPRLTGYSWASKKQGYSPVAPAPSNASAADSHIASEATAALAKLRMSGHVKATQLAAQRAALDASADTEGDGHEAAAQESLGLQGAGSGEVGSPSASVPATPPTSPPAGSFQFPDRPPPSAYSGPHAVRQSSEGVEDDPWEMVQSGSNIIGFDSAPNNAALHLHPSSSAHLSPEDVAVWQKLMIAIQSVPPVSTEYPEDSRYNTLLQISIGQEETDDIISRDINRTFPEHPQFGYEQGQKALFRVLKAYSLHDLEVQYCQGMGFLAGVMLMYLPEEPSFRMLTTLLDERGPNLRRLYLPGLEGLKQQLRMLEWLLERHSPHLAKHLQVNMVSPVLYASQWFLTLFACPFPSHFSARIMDIILFKGTSDILMQAALAVVAECEKDLLALEDFEDILTFLKVEPVEWSDKKLRKVLNTAVASVVTGDMIRAADFAVSTGYSGSLSRRTSSRMDMTTGGGHSRSHSIAGSTAPSAPSVTGEAQGVDANDLSTALGAVDTTEGSALDLAEAPGAVPVVGPDDLEMVLAMEMLRELPMDGIQTPGVQRLDSITEHPSSAKAL